MYLLDETPICFALLLSGIALSRCFEIFYAFFRDSYDKLITNATKESKVTKEVTESTIFPAIEFLIYTKKSICSNEPLTYPERLVLAFRSYIELIFNFAILYLILPSGSFSRETLSSIDILYYSGLTITTVGYGDITPIHWFPKFLSVFEAICGIIIIVVCFTVYVSLALREEKT